MKQEQVKMMRAAGATPVLLVTDSPDPSGVGHHMITLAAHLGPEWHPRLVFQASEAALRFVALARAEGLQAEVVAAAGWGAVFGEDPGLCHVHAGIGWEGLGLVSQAHTAGWTVVRTEHLPFLLTDAGERQDHLAMLGQVDGLISVSAAAGESWVAGLRHAGRHAGVTVIANGIAPVTPSVARRDVRCQLCVEENASLFLHVGRLAAQKGQAALLEAFSQVVRRHADARLMIVGQGEMQAALMAQIARLGLTHAVTLQPVRDDMADVMAAADALVLPSVFEGLPLVVLEAMAAGLPVVATRIGGVEEALGADHPFLVPPGDVDALAAAILIQVADPAKARDVAARQKVRFAGHFTAGRMAAETMAAYRLASARADKRRESLVRKKAMKTVVDIGFVGAGGIAARHLGVLQQFADVRIAAVCDADMGRATAMADPAGAVAYADVGAMLAAGPLDALFICVPPFAHGPAERVAIAARIPFFVEKPLTHDLALAEAIAAEVAAAGLITAVGYHWRYLDTVDRARRALADRPAQLIVGHWHDSTPPPAWWGRQAESGGQMVEQATHLIDTARFLAGGISSVYGVGNHLARGQFPGLDVATSSVAAVTFANGAVGSFSATCVLNWSHRQGLHIFADGLAIELSDREVMIDTGTGRHPVGAEGDPVWREDRDFIDAVRGGANHIRTSYADALETHRAVLAVMEAMETGAARLLTPVAATPVPPGGALRRQSAGRHQQRQVRSLGIEGPGVAAIFDYEEGPAGPGDVRIDTLYTGLSAGTELTFLKNTNPYLSASWDADAGVFRAGAPAIRYPVPFLGYMEVGRVIDTQREGFAVGDVVAGAWGHKTGHTTGEGLYPCPASLEPVLGIFVAQMGPIAANAILYADALAHGRTPVAFGAGVAGRRVLVWGGGTVGLMTALFARAAGAAEVVVVEPSAFRRHVAARLELEAETEDTAVARAKAWGVAGDRGADLVFQTRAHGHSLHLALRALRPHGTVIDLAFYQGGIPELRLGEEFHHNGLGLIAAQIGRVPAGLGDVWTRAGLAEETLRLLAAEGAAIRGAMITHVVPFDEAPGFLAHLLRERPEFLQVVFEVGP